MSKAPSIQGSGRPAGLARFSGDGLALLTVFLFGSTYAAAKPIVDGMHPILFATVRMLPASLLILAAAWAARQPLRLVWGDVRPIVVAALIGVTGFQGAWSLALERTPASEGAVLIATSPIFGALFARFRGERAGPFTWAGVLLAFAGVALVVNKSFTHLTLGTGSLLGGAFWLVAAALWALFTAISPPLVARHGALKATGWITLVGAVALLPWAGPLAAAQDWGRLSGADWLRLAYVMAAVSALGSVTWYGGLKRLGVTRTMVYVYLVPVFAVLIAFTLLGETFTAAQVAGSAAVLAGIVLTRLAPRPR